MDYAGAGSDLRLGACGKQARIYPSIMSDILIGCPYEGPQPSFIILGMSLAWSSKLRGTVPKLTPTRYSGQKRGWKTRREDGANYATAVMSARHGSIGSQRETRATPPDGWGSNNQLNRIPITLALRWPTVVLSHTGNPP